MAAGPTRLQRCFAVGVVLLVLVAGLAEVEAWPLTGWRLFSESRRAEQTGWSLEAADADGDVAVVGLGRLPMAYRLAAWRFRELPATSAEEQQEVCGLLLAEVETVRPSTVALEIVRTRRRLDEQGGRTSQVLASEVVASCSRKADR